MVTGKVKSWLKLRSVVCCYLLRAAQVDRALEKLVVVHQILHMSSSVLPLYFTAGWKYTLGIRYEM